MFDHLLSSVRIRELELPNRIVVAPMGVEIAQADGRVREPVIAYYEERARGGAGLIITENTAAGYPRGANSAHELGVSSDEFLPGLQALTERIHAQGGRIAIQLAHHGKVARLDTQQGRELLMPSVPERAFHVSGPLDLTPEEMVSMAKAAGGRPATIREAETGDLEQLVADFAEAAERSRRAGFDGIEIHGAHGYIFSEFLSPAWNRRQDEYGGSSENRARLLCETLRACRAAAGDDFPIWCRIDAREFSEPGGIELKQAVETARWVERAGADAIHVSAYAPPLGAGFTQGPIVHEPGGYAEFAREVRANVSVPVIAVGRISPELGNQMIRDGDADLIAMGRPMLADPEIADKLSRGQPEAVRPCIYCYTCVAQPFFDQRVRCAVNPVTARESELAQRLRQPAPTRKRVVVVGGGPAGLEAARVAAMRGHDVTLFEQRPQLGGTLTLAALVYEANEELLNWLVREVQQSSVALRLGEAARLETVRALEPDVVIVATGARRERSRIPGSEMRHVLDGDSLRSLLHGDEGTGQAPGLALGPRMLVGFARRLGLLNDLSRLRNLSRHYMPVGRRVAIVGGGLVGIELAEFLAARGRRVSVLEEGGVMAVEMAHPRRWRILHDVRAAGVDLIVGARVQCIAQREVEYSVSASEAEVEMHRLEADTVILTLGLVSNSILSDELRGAGIEPIVIGDCTGVGYIEGAIREGFQTGIEIGEP